MKVFRFSPLADGGCRRSLSAAVALLAWLCFGAPLIGADVSLPGAGEIRTAAEAGDTSAQVRLGSFYFSCRQYEQACHWVRKAAAAGDPEGEYNLAVCLADGFGAAEDRLEERELVRILDSFTKLEAELEAELEARRRQYEFYRDKLLSFNELHIGQLGGGKTHASR